MSPNVTNYRGGLSPAGAGMLGAWSAGGRRVMSPLSAATLLLLVSLVMSGSPAAPVSSLARTVDERPCPVSSAQSQAFERTRVSRRRCAEQRPDAVAEWAGLVVAADRGRVPAMPSLPGPIGHAARMDVRIGLLDLPPPVI